MAYAITPSLGADINYLKLAKPFYDANESVMSPALGTMVKGSDGHDYVLAQASGTVASGATVTLTEPAMTFATGTGWTAPTLTGGFVSGNYAWLKRTAI
jgi:hypothetical protein